MYALQRSAKSAFTLIELLVVIAIIAILAAILFPVFAAAREKARATTCASNEKQLGLAILQYVQDFDEAFPPGGIIQETGDSGPPPATASRWGQLVEPYTGSWNIFHCPDDAQPVPAGATANNYETWVQWGSYGYNYEFLGDHGDWTNDHGFIVVKLTSKVPSPTTTLMLLDVSTPMNSPASSGCDRADPGDDILSTNRHSDGTNVCYCDGHVKWSQGGGIGPAGRQPGNGWSTYWIDEGPIWLDNNQVWGF